jgi:hypothetical protein
MFEGMDESTSNSREYVQRMKRLKDVKSKS